MLICMDVVDTIKSLIPKSISGEGIKRVGEG